MNEDVQCGTVFDVAGTVVTEESVVNIGVPNLSASESDCATEIAGITEIRVSKDSNAINVFRKVETPFGICIAWHARDATRPPGDLALT